MIIESVISIFSLTYGKLKFFFYLFIRRHVFFVGLFFCLIFLFFNLLLLFIKVGVRLLCLLKRFFWHILFLMSINHNIGQIKASILLCICLVLVALNKLLIRIEHKQRSHFHLQMSEVISFVFFLSSFSVTNRVRVKSCPQFDPSSLFPVWLKI